MNAHTKMQNFNILILIKTIIFNGIFNSPYHSKDLNMKELDFLFRTYSQIQNQGLEMYFF